jgi:hypothetical protein
MSTQEKSLRKLIRTEVNKALTEARGTSGVPRQWSDFRTTLAQALEKSHAPEMMTMLVGDLGNEGHLVAPLYSTWESISYELDEAEKDGDDVRDAWNQVIDGYIEDLVFDMMGELRNPMNFGPGDAPDTQVVDPDELAERLIANLQL